MTVLNPCVLFRSFIIFRWMAQFVHIFTRLKLGCDFQYVLKAEGSSAAEVLGKDYKTVLKPFVNEASDETKKSSVAKLEEKISLQQQSREKSILLDERKELLSTLQKKIDEVCSHNQN